MVTFSAVFGRALRIIFVFMDALSGGVVIGPKCFGGTLPVAGSGGCGLPEIQVKGSGGTWGGALPREPGDKAWAMEGIDAILPHFIPDDFRKRGGRGPHPEF